MANAGVPINFVKEYARHSDIKTTLKYYVSINLLKMAPVINEKVSLLKSGKESGKEIDLNSSQIEENEK